jgi:serine/threonine-protein kinase
LWSDRYDRDLDDIFEVQSDIAQKVIDQLNVTLLEPERSILTARPTNSIEAYQAYLRGRDYAANFLEVEFPRSVEMFERAVTLDPGFALAHAELSIAHSFIYHNGHDHTQERLAKAKAAIDRALELQPDLAEAHLALGYYHNWGHRDYAAALQELTIAARSLPNESDLFHALGVVSRRRGSPEAAVKYWKHAFALNPKDAHLPIDIGHTHMTLGDYAEAKRYFDRSISLAPIQLAAYVDSARNHYLWDGDTGKARTVLESVPREKQGDVLSIEWFWLELFDQDYQAALDHLQLIPAVTFEDSDELIVITQLSALAYQSMKKVELAQSSDEVACSYLEVELKKRPDDPLVLSALGLAYAGLGEKEKAIRMAQRGVELTPMSRDAVSRPTRIRQLALVYVKTGENDRALNEISTLFSIPSRMSIPMLHLDPRWKPLLKHPEFERLSTQK